MKRNFDHDSVEELEENTEHCQLDTLAPSMWEVSKKSTSLLKQTRPTDSNFHNLIEDDQD